jgi:glutamate N-acetyltransferase/amino-acid N-acetyltransferase
VAVGLTDRPEVLAVPGVRLGVARAGLRRGAGDDLAVFDLAPGAVVCGVFTRNAFCAAPVTVARRHLVAGTARYLLVNAGNANAGTGAQGLADALACCEALGGIADVQAQEVLPFSTGVIGERLPVDQIAAALPAALASRAEDGWLAAARAIMTTDTVPKAVSRRFVAAGREYTVSGIAKGSGMIRPDMATMLAFLATDAPVVREVLDACLEASVAVSFNRVTVDGDTSTNDACVIAATGAGGGSPIDAAAGDSARALGGAVAEVCLELAQAMVRDGEGATKFITVDVRGGRDEAECLRLAYEVAHSPLVKTAMFASDANWGRILAVVGRAGVPDLDLEAVRIHLGDVCIVSAGGRDPAYREAAGQAVMAREEITVTIDLGRGGSGAEIWTCDLSHDYVRINAEYRT